MVAVEELENLVVRHSFVYGSGQLALPHTGENPLDCDIFVDAIVFEEVDFEVIGVASSMDGY